MSDQRGRDARFPAAEERGQRAQAAGLATGQQSGRGTLGVYTVRGLRLPLGAEGSVRCVKNS